MGIEQGARTVIAIEPKNHSVFRSIRISPNPCFARDKKRKRERVEIEIEKSQEKEKTPRLDFFFPFQRTTNMIVPPIKT